MQPFFGDAEADPGGEGGTCDSPSVRLSTTASIGEIVNVVKELCGVVQDLHGQVAELQRDRDVLSDICAANVVYDSSENVVYDSACCCLQ